MFIYFETHMLRTPVVLALLCLAACTGGPQTYTATPMALPFAAAGAGYQGMLPINITTQIRSPDLWDNIAGHGLVDGAKCVAQTPAFRLSFVAPAKIEVPDYGRLSPPIRITCRINTLAGSTQVVPHDMSREARHLDALIKPHPRWTRPLLRQYQAGGPPVWTYAKVAVVFLDPT